MPIARLDTFGGGNIRIENCGERTENKFKANLDGCEIQHYIRHVQDEGGFEPASGLFHAPLSDNSFTLCISRQPATASETRCYPARMDQPFHL